jgi:hypothetical protein
MPKSTREPSLLKDVGAIAGLYIDLFRMMEKRATGHSLIVKYTPPEEMPPEPHAAVAAPDRKREHAHAGR